MPKVELHVHLEGSIRPETVLKLAARHGVKMPADTVEGLQEWYTFRDFPHFVEVYVAVSNCIRTADDIELIAREFLQGQAEQNILHSEVTFTAGRLEADCLIPWPDQMAALERALEYGRSELNVTAAFILDIVRGHPLERAKEVAQWAIEGHKRGVVCALGLAGEEREGTLQYAEAIKLAEDAGVPFLPHAGETVGPQSILDCFAIGNPVRIGHGVRCTEDVKVLTMLRDRQIPLEVCPTSNIRLGVYPDLDHHPLPRLLDEGLYVTVNSDDPPMFGTTLSDEFARTANAYGFNEDILWSLSQNAARSALLPVEAKSALMQRMREEFNEIADDED